MSEDIRMTVRLPGDAEAFLAEEARENFTSKNAQVVQAIRAAMRAKAMVATRHDTQATAQ